MTAWQEANGTAYLARSVQNAYLGVSKLDDSFSETTGICASTEQVNVSTQADEQFTWDGKNGHQIILRHNVETLTYDL